MPAIEKANIALMQNIRFTISWARAAVVVAKYHLEIHLIYNIYLIVT